MSAQGDARATEPAGERLYFLSEAKLAQSAGFIEAGLASLARLQAAPPSTIDAVTLQGFAEMASMAGSLRRQLAADLAPLLVDTGPWIGTDVDPAVKRMVGATQRVLERLDQMIAQLQRLQIQDDGADMSA